MSTKRAEAQKRNEIYVRALLEFRDDLASKAEGGRWHLVDTLNDLDQAMEDADLTAKQRGAIELIYVKHLSQDDAAERLSLSRPTVTQYLSNAITKIARVYSRWERREHAHV